MDDETILKAALVARWVELQVEPGYPRGLGACLWVPSHLETAYGWPADGGVFFDGDDLASATRAGTVYEHYWNVLSDGSILDATAGQFHYDGPVVRVLEADDPDYKRYVLWNDVPDDLTDAIDDAVQGSCPDPQPPTQPDK